MEFSQIQNSLNSTRTLAWVFLFILIIFILLVAIYSYFQIYAVYTDVLEMEKRATDANDLIMRTTEHVSTTEDLFSGFSPSTGKTAAFGATVCGFACMLHGQIGTDYPAACKQFYPSIPCT